MDSNFSFIKELFPETYDYLEEAEKNIRQDIGLKILRQALESLVEETVRMSNAEFLFKKYARMKKIPAYPELSLEHKLNVLTSEETLTELGWKGIKPLLPTVTAKIKCELLDGTKKSLDVYTFLRRYGNANSHIEKQNFIKITYPTSIKALKGFHSVLSAICKQKGIQTTPFNENRMPIGGQEHTYIIDDYKAPPTDAPMSKCQVEFLAHFNRSGSRTGTQYALIRQYDKKDVDTTFLLRNVDTVQKTQDDLIDTLPPCMVRPVEISPIENQSSPFYIIAYHFREKPHALSDELLQSLDKKNRLFICEELARCMADLHQMGIYHRLLSYASVYICDYSAWGKGWMPHLVKFDFAKLVAKIEEDELETVKEQTIEAKEMIKDKSIKKYIPLDWKLENWEKVDVYSLGILFCDILSGTISPDYNSMIKSMKQLKKSKEISDGFLNLIGTMINSAFSKRPSMAEVHKSLQAEMASWN